MNRFKLAGILIFIGICLSTQGRAEVSPGAPSGVTAEQSVEDSKIPSVDLEVIQDQNSRPISQLKVGDSIELKAGSLTWTELDTQNSGDLSEQGWEIDAKKSNENPNQTRLLVTALKPGRLTLPSVVLKDQTGKAVGRTNPFSFDIGSAIQKDDPKPTTPEDIVPPLGLKFPFWVVIFMSALGLLLLGGMIAGGYYWLIVRKPKKSALPEIVRSEDEIALNALSELEKQDWIKRNEFKPFYFRLSEILKTYIGARYQFEAPESTSGEVISFLEDKKILSDITIDQLEVMFGKLDLVKFTDSVPDLDQPAQLVEEARKFIRLTRRPPTVLETAKGESIPKELGNASK